MSVEARGPNALRMNEQWRLARTLLASSTAPERREIMWQAAREVLEGEHGDAHLVASVLVVDSGGRVLLARHRRYLRWGLLGGHLELGDVDLAAAAEREQFEESSLSVTVHRTPLDAHLSTYQCRTAEAPVRHVDVCFVGRVKTPTPTTHANSELTGLEWFDVERLPTPLVPGIAELVELAGGFTWRQPIL
jgi:8-oxo-dGTP pyrophosphatase MutT (NUDIX family)